MENTADVKINAKKQAEKRLSKPHEKRSSSLTVECLMESEVRNKPYIDDDSETVLNVVVKRPSFDITGSQTYIRASKMQHVVPSSKLAKQLAEGNTVLNLPYYGLAEGGTMALSIAMLVNTSVTCLYLRGNNIGQKGISYIQKMMVENNSITDLDLSENELKEFGAKTIATMLDTNRFIQKIDISGNEFTDSDARVLSRSIEVHPVLQFVNLSHNLFSDSSSPVFEQLLENCKLKYLDISWNQFRTHGAMHISSGLKENAYLKTFNVSWNGFDDDGGAAFGDALANNDFLTELDISSCRITAEGFGKLVCGLKSNERLEILKVGGNYIPKEAIETALDSLVTFDPSTTKIRIIDLTGIHLPRSFEQKMHEVQQVLPMLRIKPGCEESVKGSRTKPVLLDGATEGLLAIKQYLEAKSISVFKLFREFDDDNSDSIDYNEFKRGIQAAEIPLPSSKVDKLLQHLDSDHNGEIELAELATKLKGLSEKLVRSKTVS
ncbi:leucine-rich repeat-containing protein 74B-like [Mytilus edulis]|uniref:leucine-rich repeat-containing protein 74B-like n=1 Tax=Mytilus edulis TaxID=6550 RepID=UPI0039EE3A0F